MAKGLFFVTARSGVLVAVVLALTLTACGRRGALDRPGQTDPAVQSSAQTAPADQSAPADTASDETILLDVLI